MTYYSLSSHLRRLNLNLLPYIVVVLVEVTGADLGRGPGGPPPPPTPILRPKFLPPPRLRCTMSAKSRPPPLHKSWIRTWVISYTITQNYFSLQQMFENQCLWEERMRSHKFYLDQHDHVNASGHCDV